MQVPVERLVPGEGPLGCLLIHGLTGTPAEMMPIAEALAGRYPLWVARVAGHETTVDDLASSSWRDWYASAIAGADALLATTPRIVVIGLSMGALLGIRIAVERPSAVGGLALLSPALALRRRLLRWLQAPLRALGAADALFSPLRSFLAPIAFPKDGSDIADAAVRATHPGYRQIPLRALLNLLALQRAAWLDVAAIAQPTLVIHALQDHTCAVDATRAYYETLSTPHKRMVLLDDSFHVVTVDRERARVVEETAGFVDALARP